MPVIKQETILLNDYGATTANIRRRHFQSAKTGKVSVTERVTIDMRAEPIVHVFDNIALGRDVAQAMRDKLERDIKAIKSDADDRTKEFRAWAEERLTGKVGTKRLKSGKRKRTAFKSVPASLRRRYDGGRTGFKKPNADGRGVLFNDSGRLAEGVHINQNYRSDNDSHSSADIRWTVNVPKNRFTEHTRHLVDRLAEEVDSIKNPRKFLEDPKISKEIESSINLIIAKAKNERDAKIKALNLARLNALKAAFNLVKALAGS